MSASIADARVCVERADRDVAETESSIDEMFLLRRDFATSGVRHEAAALAI